MVVSLTHVQVKTVLDQRQVDHYAQAGRVDRIVAERNVVLTYAIKILSEGKNPLIRQLLFKGGTCMRKIYLGKTGRFFMDLDFTALGILPGRFPHLLRRLLHEKTYYGITFRIEDEYTREEIVPAYGALVAYSHSWNAANFQFQVSFRERPILPLCNVPLQNELYFRYMEFGPFEVPCLRIEELLAEKIRAAFQRASARDLYDMYLMSRVAYDRELTKTLVVLKLWNVRVPFDPRALLEGIAKEGYDWEDLNTLVSGSRPPSPAKLVSEVTKNYAYLLQLDGRLKTIVADSKSHRQRELITKLIQKLARAR